jgi:signal transduction histidine kinase/CheY-like chemotaxis protein
MNSSSEARVRILYEMAMAIGNSLDLDRLLSESLKVILRKLNGVSIGVYSEQDETMLHALPRRSMTDDQRNHIETALSLLDEQHRNLSGFVQCFNVDKGRTQYLFHLKRVGMLSVVCPYPLDETLLSSLVPICEKLATSIQSCWSNQKLIQQEKNLQSALFDLQRAQTARDLFLANMSHEIRTPLNGILGFLGQLEDTVLTQEQQHFLDIIRHSSDSLLGIINDILDFSKMDAGKLSLENVPYHLIDTIQPITELFRAKAEQNHTLLIFEQQGGLPAYVNGDNLRLKQIISNLLSNAVKFTKQGKVIVRLSCLDKSEKTAKLKLEVIDNGIGIPPDKIQTLGEPFAQADESTTRHFGGTGLGLAICKRLIELMGSRLEIESEPGQRTCFHFCWTAELAETPTTQATKKTQLDPIRFAGLRVLLVEDNKVNQMLMKAVLGKMGIQPILAENGAEAVELFQSQDFDLVLMDINMPIMDGVEATLSIRSYEAENQRPTTPVVALTANVLKGDQERYLEMGLDDVLAKPLDMAKLALVFERLA